MLGDVTSAATSIVASLTRHGDAHRTGSSATFQVDTFTGPTFGQRERIRIVPDAARVLGAALTSQHPHCRPQGRSGDPPSPSPASATSTGRGEDGGARSPHRSLDVCPRALGAIDARSPERRTFRCDHGSEQLDTRAKARRPTFGTATSGKASRQGAWCIATAVYFESAARAIAPGRSGAGSSQRVKHKLPTQWRVVFQTDRAQSCQFSFAARPHGAHNRQQSWNSAGNRRGAVQGTLPDRVGYETHYTLLR